MVSKNLAALRKRANLTQEQMAEKLHVTRQAVSKWESGSSVPNARQFIILCAALGVEDVLGEFTKGKYGAYAGLDSEGRRKLAEYKSLLISSGRYSIKKAPPHPVRTLPLYSLAVSAGTGQFLDGENYEMVEVGEDVPEGANFGVRVAGDSMEPEYHDGQIVWVRQQRSLMTGETGIFLYDGCAYLKRLVAREDRMALRSLNPAYSDILISPELPLRVLGKVLN